MYSFDTVLVILKEKNLKQKDLSDYLGVSENAISSWKAGRNYAWRKYLPQIAAFLGVSVDELLGEPASMAGLIPFSLPQKRVIELVSRLDEVDCIRVEGMIQLLLADEKYKKSVPAQDA